MGPHRSLTTPGELHNGSVIVDHLGGVGNGGGVEAPKGLLGRRVPGRAGDSRPENAGPAIEVVEERQGVLLLVQELRKGPFGVNAVPLILWLKDAVLYGVQDCTNVLMVRSGDRDVGVPAGDVGEGVEEPPNEVSGEALMEERCNCRQSVRGPEGATGDSLATMNNRTMDTVGVLARGVVALPWP